jgi:hypothetical protein
MSGCRIIVRPTAQPFAEAHAGVCAQEVVVAFAAPSHSGGHIVQRDAAVAAYDASDALCDPEFEFASACSASRPLQTRTNKARLECHGRVLLVLFAGC